MQSTRELKAARSEPMEEISFESIWINRSAAHVSWHQTLLVLWGICDRINHIPGWSAMLENWGSKTGFPKPARVAISRSRHRLPLLRQIVTTGRLE